MTRPTTRDLADAHEDIEVIAYAHDPLGSPRFNSAFPELAGIVNKVAWLIGEIKAAERSAAHGPGVKDGYRTLQRGGTPSDVSSRIPDGDAYYRAGRNLLAGWAVAFARMDDEMGQEARDFGRYPTPSEQDDWQRQLMAQVKPTTRSEQAV